MSTKVRSNFGGANSGSSSRSIFGLYFSTIIKGPLWLWLQSHLCLTLAHWGGVGVNSRSICGIMLTLCYLQNSIFCPITPFQVVRFQKSIHKQGSFFQDDCFEYQHCHVIFNIKHFVQ